MSNWSSQPDEAIRRAAAGVCGLLHNREISEWYPDTNRDDLARVFAAARPRLSECHICTITPGSLTVLPDGDHCWLIAMTDPRAALTQLLDLLQVPLPAAARE